MTQIPHDIRALCEKLSGITYENLTKIIRYAQSGTAGQAQRLDDSFQNDLDHWMGGGTCFSITWHLFQELEVLGYRPRLLMGHKRKERNVHCALRLDLEGTMLFFDPGYLIFDPLMVPPLGAENMTLLVPNHVSLRRDLSNGLSLWTAQAGQPYKLRFEFPLEGVEIGEFHAHWRSSFAFEMMQYPVLNRLDRERGVQYYFQKGNLVVRDSQGSQMQKIAPRDQVRILSETFRLEPALVESALRILITS